MVKPPLRTKSIGFKVSEEEYAQLETAAQAGGQTLGKSLIETSSLNVTLSLTEQRHIAVAIS
jgi:hypothetical protein